jgi:hypothetical protein
MDAVYVERRAIVTELLDGRLCERCEESVATEVHERLTRGRSGNTAKAILDRSNLVCLCSQCHRFVTQETRQAEVEGWVLSSWGTASRS